MLKDKLDKSFVDASWNEMKEILDREMPIEEKRRAFLFWLYGLAGAFLLLIIGLNIYSEIQTPKTTESITILNQDVESIPKFENAIKKEDVDYKEIKNQANSSKLNESSQPLIQEVKTSSSALSVFNSSKQNPTASDELIGLVRNTKIRNNQESANESSNISKFNEIVTSPDENIVLNTHKERSPVAFTPPLTTFFNPLNTKTLYHPKKDYNQIQPINQEPMERYEIALSNRIHDQPNVNGELSASMIFPASKFWISAGLGVGLDQYDLSPGIDQISLRTLISKEVEANRFSVTQEPPTNSYVETRIYNQDRTLYFSPQINIGIYLAKSFRFGIGYQPRVFIDNRLQDQADNLQEGDSGVSVGQANQSGFSDLDLETDRIDHYWSSNLKYFLSPKFSVGISYLRQIDKSIQLKPLDKKINLYDNILEKVNRSEIRLGLSYLF